MYQSGTVTTAPIDLTDANGVNLAHVNLADFLAANPVVDLTRHEALIPIRIVFNVFIVFSF